MGQNDPMHATRRKIISGLRAQNLPKLTDAEDVAVAEVSRHGIVLEINDLGGALLGWKKNDRLAAPIASAIKSLPEGPPMRLPIGRQDIYVVGVSRGEGASCLLFGFDTSTRSEGKTGPFQRLLDRLPVAITRTNREGVVSFANRHARKFTGKDPVGSSLWRDIVLDSDHWKLDAAFDALSKEGHASTTITYVDFDGNHRSATLYLYPVEGDFIDIASVDSSLGASDISEPSTDVRYKTMVEQSPVAMVHLDSDGIIVLENHPFRLLIGENPENAWIGRHYTEVVDMTPEFVETIRLMLDNGTPFQVDDLEFESPTGDYVLSLRGAPIVQEDGRIDGGVVIVEDRTSQKKAEEIIEQARQKAEDSAARKSAFISTMSHELRTPLGAIQGYSDLLLEELRELEKTNTDLPDVLREFVSTIHERSAGVLSIVDNLFDMALMDSGLIGLDAAPIDARVVVERAIEARRERFELKGIKLSADYSRDEGTPIESDERRLEQVIAILLDNALKFTPDGSVEVVVSQGEGVKQIEVLDTGIGMDEETMELLFTPLTQGDSRLNRQFDGAGIGLAMVERVVKKMSGRILVRNRKNGGSAFTLELPLSTA